MKIEKTTPEYDNYAVIEAGTHIGNIHNRSVDSVFRFEPTEDTWYTAEHLVELVHFLDTLNAVKTQGDVEILEDTMNKAWDEAAEAAEAALRG